MFELARKAKFVAVLLGVVAVSVGPVSPAGATPPSPVMIETVIDFSSFPFVGTFVVAVGADVLGCSAGTFVDIPRGAGIGQIEKHITCSAGIAAGDEIVVLFKNDCTWLSQTVFRCKPGPGEIDGQWMVLSGTGHFADLHGNGEFSVRFPDDVTGEEQLTGSIHFG